MKSACRLFLATALALCAASAHAEGRHVLRYWSFLDPASKDPRSVAQTQMIDAFKA